jgi:hypothetical protein
VATVAEGKTSSIGSVTSPVTLFTVGGSDTEFILSCAIALMVPPDGVLNSQGTPATALLTLVYGWTNPGGMGPGSNSISGQANTWGLGLDAPNSYISAFKAAAGTTIWYYTIWTVDSATAENASYVLSITLTEPSS